jgi:hypothetical protein
MKDYGHLLDDINIRDDENINKDDYKLYGYLILALDEKIAAIVYVQLTND